MAGDDTGTNGSSPATGAAAKPKLRSSTVARDLILTYEPFLETAKPRGQGWVVGYGHSATARAGATVARQDAELLLFYDMLAAEKAIREAAGTDLPQPMFDALVSFAVSIGVNAFKASDVAAHVKAGRHVEAAEAMETWVYDPAPGWIRISDRVFNRRRAERALYLSGLSGAEAARAYADAGLDAAALAEAADRAMTAGVELTAEGAAARPAPETVRKAHEPEPIAAIEAAPAPRDPEAYSTAGPRPATRLRVKPGARPSPAWAVEPAVRFVKPEKPAPSPAAEAAPDPAGGRDAETANDAAQEAQAQLAAAASAEAQARPAPAAATQPKPAPAKTPVRATVVRAGSRSRPVWRPEPSKPSGALEKPQPQPAEADPPSPARVSAETEPSSPEAGEGRSAAPAEAAASAPPATARPNGVDAPEAERAGPETEAVDVDEAAPALPDDPAPVSGIAEEEAGETPPPASEPDQADEAAAAEPSQAARDRDPISERRAQELSQPNAPEPAAPQAASSGRARVVGPIAMAGAPAEAPPPHPMESPARASGGAGDAAAAARPLDIDEDESEAEVGPPDPSLVTGRRERAYTGARRRRRAKRESGAWVFLGNLIIGLVLLGLGGGDLAANLALYQEEGFVNFGPAAAVAGAALSIVSIGYIIARSGKKKYER